MAPTGSHERESLEKFPEPLLRLEIRDLSSQGARIFLKTLDASKALDSAVRAVVSALYTSRPSIIPPTRSVTLILMSMPGVAFTKGSDLDKDHKEITFSTDYIESVPESRWREEMMGVIVHEMVHCWQYDGKGGAPGGLIEGLADFVRLRADYSPPHWRKEADGEWDNGYEHTAYFLDWLETKYGDGTIEGLNAELREPYDEDKFWHKLFSHDVHTLWEQYGEDLEHSSESDDHRGRTHEDDEGLLVIRG